MATQPVVQRERLHDQGLGTSWLGLVHQQESGEPREGPGSPSLFQILLSVDGDVPPWQLLCGDSRAWSTLGWRHGGPHHPCQGSFAPSCPHIKRPPPFSLNDDFLSSSTGLKVHLRVNYFYASSFDWILILNMSGRCFSEGILKNTDGNTKLFYFLRDQHSYD